ncbi:50S ribosomal protein L7Ae/L30e/S12e/Gadd45 [endosymbiont 'TC1' of Trimyema compressum]|uniref:ribosomal L7Ae/L30e/S12e/Gadd45 family protein n=1 Tax=endosymbiont 'TC1' of Trimyema compressum TaxID=243899 RepID=UPI0007F12413|nr:ribosomal L7Ae/L30e/S12e/Gadd45 family protein [endosymbiont 'TC1' of Trimyema compressum]AMP20316.1 50S ribosomal protein L7Ae/L30e/S12e/Gadd45 [endosymbiont 'TC1' of Trimyema compressum]
MSLDELKIAKRRTVGTKQTKKALQNSQLKAVYVAMDAEHKVTKPLVEIINKKGLPICWVETKYKLGKACGIEVGTAIAGVLKEEE